MPFDIVDIAILVIAAYLVWDFIRAYKAAIGSVLARTVAAAKGGAASLWTGFTVIVSLAVSGLAYVANLVAAVMIASAVLIEAQRRTSAKA
jgi:hypothetical protein